MLPGHTNLQNTYNTHKYIKLNIDKKRKGMIFKIIEYVSSGVTKKQKPIVNIIPPT